MKQVTKISKAPIAGLGIIVKKEDKMGKKARRVNNPPAAKAIRRLVAPVAMETPTLLDDVDCAIAPSSAATTVPRELARIPRPMDFMSGGFHSTSLIFWQVAMSPAALRVEARDANRKGASIAQAKDQ